MNKIVTYGDEYRKYYKVDDRTYYTYDDVNLKYLYICSTCDTVWKTDDKV